MKKKKKKKTNKTQEEDEGEEEKERPCDWDAPGTVDRFLAKAKSSRREKNSNKKKMTASRGHGGCGAPVNPSCGFRDTINDNDNDNDDGGGEGEEGDEATTTAATRSVGAGRDGGRFPPWARFLVLVALWAALSAWPYVEENRGVCVCDPCVMDGGRVLVWPLFDF
jgi:hypothetical protein